jgi:hypothetical protein
MRGRKCHDATIARIPTSVCHGRECEGLKETYLQRRVLPNPITRRDGPTRCSILSETRRAQLSAIGIGSFGPLDLEPTSQTYGYIIQPRSESGRIATSLGR